MPPKLGWEKSPNEGPRGELHDIAIRQLEQRQAITKDWPTFFDHFEGDTYVRCKRCDLALYQVAKNYQNYVYDSAEVQTMITAHIANHHPEAFSGIE
jgi:hypothetical protein